MYLKSNHLKTSHNAVLKTKTFYIVQKSIIKRIEINCKKKETLIATKVCLKINY